MKNKTSIKGLNPAQMLTLANKLERGVEDLSNAKRKKMGKRIAAIRFYAKSKSKSPKKKKNKVSKTVKNPAQGLLPGFTDIVIPNVDELARDLVFKALRAQLDVEIENVIKTFKKA
jgi:hypothetical protein